MASRPYWEAGLLTGLILAAMAGAAAHYYFGFSHWSRIGHAWGADDAYISYRYAENLANGQGLVFNPGERVEGYSNFLYVVLIAALLKLTAMDAYSLSFLANMACFAATLLLFAWYAGRTSPPGGRLLACAILCLCPLLWAWPATGLETSAVVLVQLALWIAADYSSKDPTARRLGVLFLLTLASILLRADGYIFPILCGALFLIRSRYRELAAFALFTALVVAICTVARYGYYGVLFPNTYYAKVCCTVGERFTAARKQLDAIAYYDAFVLYLLPMLFGWRPFLVMLCKHRRFDLSLVPPVPVVAAGLLAYWFYVGGFDDKKIATLFHQGYWFFVLAKRDSHSANNATAAAESHGAANR